MTMTVVRSRRARSSSAASSSAMLADLLGVAPRLARMRGEVDIGQRLVAGVLQQVVEALAAGRLLQPVDAAEAAVVEHDDDELEAEHHRGGDLGIHHQIGAVADHDDDFARRVAPS